jgi:hypothetical protein
MRSLTRFLSASPPILFALALGACSSAPDDAAKATSEAVMNGRAHVRLRASISVSMTRHNDLLDTGQFQTASTDTDALTLIAAVQGTNYAAALQCIFGQDVYTPDGPGVSIFPKYFDRCADSSLAAAVEGTAQQPLVLPIQVPYGMPLTTGFRVDDVNDSQAIDWSFRTSQAIGSTLQIGETAVSVIPVAGSYIGATMQIAGSLISTTSSDGSTNCAGPLLPGPTHQQLVTFSPWQVMLADGGQPQTLDWDFEGDPTPVICGPMRSMTHVRLTLERDTSFAPKIHIEPPWAGPPHSFGGNVHRIAAALNADGHIETYVSGNHELPFLKEQPWSADWLQLMPYPVMYHPVHINGAIDAGPVMAQNSNHQMVAFSLGGGEVGYQLETQTTPPVWTPFTAIPHPQAFNDFTYPGRFASAPAIIQRPSGALELFATDNKGNVWSTWSYGQSTYPWSTWASLGAPPAGAVGQPTLAVNLGGGIEMHVLSGDGTIWGRMKGDEFAVWSGWFQISTFASIYEPVLARNWDGRLEVFAVNTSHRLCHRWHTQAVMLSPWSDWACELGDGHGGYLTAKPAVINNSDGSLNVFVRGGEAWLWHVYQTFDPRGWSAWETLNGNIDTSYGPSAITVTSNADGRVEVYYRSGIDQSMTGVWQLSP